MCRQLNIFPDVRVIFLKHKSIMLLVLKFFRESPFGACLVIQSCLTFCGPMDCNQPGSSVHGISKQEYWSGLPFSPPGDLPDPGTEPEFLVSPAVAGRFFISAPSGKPYKSCSWCLLFLFAENPLPQNFPFPISGCFLLLWQLPQSFNMYLNSVHDWLAPRELQRRAGPFRIWTPN